MLDKEKYLTLYHEKLLKSHIQSTTIITKMKYARLLIDHLNNHYNLNDLQSAEKNMIYSYINSANFSESYSSTTKFGLRDFFDFMFSIGESKFDGRSLFPIIKTNKRRNLISFYSPEEISDMLDTFETSDKFGNRDKCMTLIAAKTGLRASDVVWLRFDEINWDGQIINKTQRKTKLPVTVSFDDDIKFSLIDYLKNYRPHIKSEYVFINAETNEPFEKATCLTNAVHHHFKKSNVNVGKRKSGAHALRFSLSASLLSDNTPLPVITGILGHDNLETTKRYLSIDIENLRHVGLEVPSYE